MQKTAYEMRISDWSSDVCSSDLRAEAAQRTTDFYLALHLGRVYFGNIGSADRLDFTVIGPAVNEVSRIMALCSSVRRPLLMSARFADTVAGSADEAGAARLPLASVGRFGSEERRGGKEGVSTCRSRWSPD